MRTAVAAGSGSGGCSPSSFRDLFRKLLLSGPCRVVNETLWGSVMAMAKSYQASRHRSHCIWKGLSGISPRVTEDDGSRTSTLLLEFSREVTKGRGVSACCNHQREERKKSILVPVFPPNWKLPAIPSVHCRSLSSQHSAPFVRAEGNPAAGKTKRAREAGCDAAQEPWA